MITGERESEREGERDSVCVCVVPLSLHTYQVWFSLVSLFNGKSTMDVSGLQKNPELLPWGIFNLAIITFCVKPWFGVVSLSNVISTLFDYLIPKPSFKKNSRRIIQAIEGGIMGFILFPIVFARK